MLVYHGSYVKIDKIDLTKCSPNKDFGRGFYVTKFIDHAESWAKVKGKRNKTNGVITEFLYYDSPFTEHLCKVKHFNAYSEEWLDFVVLNRDPMSNMHDYDIVEGPIANDKIQSRIFDFLNGRVNKKDFLSELVYHEDTHQICFCTLKSLLTLKSRDHSPTSDFAYICEEILKKLMLDQNIDELMAMDIFYESDTFKQLAITNTDLHQYSWQEIYKQLSNDRTLHPTIPYTP